MDACCSKQQTASDGRYARVLAVALVLNALMFAVEIISGLAAGSSSLLADAADFAGDAGNYALSLGALALAPVWRSRAALLKGAAMATYGAAVIAIAGWHAFHGTRPEAGTMGVIGALAMAVNIGVAGLLYRYRAGDADMRSVWLCTRNDVIGNIAVILAAAGVFGFGSGWPDYVVAAIMAALAITASVSVVRHARREILDASCVSVS
jgi:Co/Zn/Cd efflux system component